MITYGSTTLTSYNSIVKTEVYYYKSTSATSLSGGSWSTTKPTWENGKYIWQKIRTVYEDGTHTESDPVNITGQQGATGTAAYSYKLNSSDSIIGKTKDGEYTIKKITFSATYKQGTGAVSAYSGRFKIESTTNGSTWKTEYTSSGNEASKEFTIPDDIILIKCSLYQSDGTTVLLDIVTVPVVKDGVDAIGLRDSIPYYLASDKDTGITKLTQGWTRYRPQLTAEKKYLWVYYVSRYSEGSTEPELIEIKDDSVHFVNNGDESPVESCVVDIEPVQDLHGYDSPWPAGGGKNLIIDAENIVIDKLGSAEGSRNEYSYINVGQSYMDVPDGTNVTISFDIEMVVNTANPRLQVYNTNNKGPKQIMGVTKTFTAAVGTTIKERCSLTTTIADRSDTTQTNNAIEFYAYYGSSNFYRITNIMLEIGTTASAFEPYSNICPITGWTAAKVTRTGKNLLDTVTVGTTHRGVTYAHMEDGGISIIGTATNNTSYSADFGKKILKAGTYKLSVTGLLSGMRCTAINETTKNAVAITTTISSFTLRNDTPIHCYIAVDKDIVVNTTAYVQIELGSTATAYEPYSGQTYDITFPIEAGTVYGGQLNVTTGELTVDRAMVVIDGVNKTVRENGITSMTSNVWFSSAVGKAYGRNNFISDRFATGIGSHAGGMSGRDNSIGVEFLLPTDIPNNSTALNQWFADNPTQLCYELAEPITYRLTPQEITMLCKENNIFADTGQTAISYYDNQTSTDPYVDYSLTSAFDASTIEPAYIETEWVESTGKQYVYLDWKPPIKTWGFEIDFISYNALGTSVGAWNEDTNKNGYGTIFGVRNYSGVNNAQLSSYSNGTLRIGNGANQATGFKTNHTRQQIKLQNTTITKTDGTTSTVSRLDETANKPYCNMTVFGLHDGLRRAGNGGISEPSSTRIYSLKFYDGDTLAVDLVGAIRKRDSVTGLYDKVSKHFYPAPGMLFGDVIGDIGDSISMKEAMDKANPQTIVVNKDRTRMWEATVPFNDLQDGQKITVTYSYGNVASSVETDELIGWDDTSNNQQVYLKLTFADGHKTDWIPCYYSNTGRLTTHYGAGIPIQLTYRENILANASETASGNMVLRGFFADANYDTNNTDIVRWSYGRVIAGSNKIFPYSIIMQNEDERWESIITSSTTAKTKTRNTHGFRLDTILYQAANTTTNENAENTSYQLRTGDPIMDMRYNLNIEDTNELRLVHGKSVYLVGTVGTDGLFYLADQWWSQSLPTTEDGKIYIFLGQVYDWYRCGLATMHPIYKFVDGKLKSTLQIAVDALDKAKEVAQDLADLGADLQSQIDGKIETWCQITDPSTAWTTTELKNQHNGDLWYYTGESTSSYKNNTTYKYTASTNKWTAYSASTDLFDKVDGKTTVFYGKTTDTFADVETGDYLVDATDGSSYRYDGSKWVKVTDYQAAIDSMSIGGRNLFVTASRFHPEENAFTTTSTGKDNHIENFNVKGGIYTVEPFKAGDAITLQAQSNLPWNNRHASDGTAPNTVGFWIQAYDTMEDARARRNLKRSQFLTNDLGENHTSFLRTFTVPQSDDGRYYNFRFNSYSDGTQSVTAKFWDLQLERGNKATSWSPALEDLQVNIEGAEKRNLLLNTQNKTYSGYTMYYDLSESGQQLQEGEVVTFSMKATIPVDRKRWAIYNSGGYLAISQWETIEPDGETAVIYTWTGVWKLYLNDEPVANDKLYVYIGAVGATSSVTVEWAKLERGNTMSTYSPAPEDINSSIATAQTTADTAMDRATAIYGTCSTATGTAAKAVTCPNFVLFDGARIQVTFANANTASAPTLNVNSTGAKPIYINKTITSSSNLLLWTAGSKMEFVYDGTGWIAQNVPYALYGTCPTGASTAAKAVTCNEAVICKGTTISVNMTNTNTAANATMNVGSTVAKDIYANGAKLTTNSRFNWRANTTQKFVFDGQVWRMDDDSVKALATAYITEIDDDGIMVHPEDDDTSGWAISDAIQLFKNEISYIKLWIGNTIANLRLGNETKNNIQITEDGTEILDGDKVLASYSSDGIYFDDKTTYRIGNSQSFIEYVDTDNDGDADSIRIVADQISFTSGTDIRTEMTQLSDNIDITQANIDAVQSTTEQNIVNLQQEVNNHSGSISEIKESTNAINKYVNINPSVPSITVGTSQNTYVEITSEEVDFITDGNKTAYMSNDQMNIPTATVTNLFMQTTNPSTGETIGDLYWVMRSNGHLSLKVMN